ncbi:hypothetical protein ISS06_02550 [Patescibacteria group bacterium]|nr:hypothetical protein [Patescibacteria group bacterium]
MKFSFNQPEQMPEAPSQEKESTGKIIEQIIERWEDPSQEVLNLFTENDSRNMDEIKKYPESNLKKVFLYSRDMADLIRKNPSFLKDSN